MVKFVGLECVTVTVAEDIEKQLKEDKCVCSACWIAFVTLSNSCFRQKSLTKKSEKYVKKIRKIGDNYWNKLGLKSKVSK